MTISKVLATIEYRIEELEDEQAAYHEEQDEYWDMESRIDELYTLMNYITEEPTDAEF